MVLMIKDNIVPFINLLAKINRCTNTNIVRLTLITKNNIHIFIN